MKNLHKLTFTTAVLSVCLSSGVFAMNTLEEEVDACGETSAGQPRRSASVATSSATSSDIYCVPLVGIHPYEHWLERRVASFASSKLFLGIPEEDREGLKESLIKFVIPSWQSGAYHLFYHPGMERFAPTFSTQLKCLNAELAILNFERQSIAFLVKRVTEPGSLLFELATITENTCKDKETRVRRAGQEIATQIVEILKITPEEKAKEARRAELRGKWGHKLPPMKGIVRDLDPICYTSDETGKIIRGLAADHCRPALFQNEQWRQDLRMNQLFNLPDIMSEEGYRLAIDLYNQFYEEKLLEDIEAAEVICIREEAEAAREKARLEARERAARQDYQAFFQAKNDLLLAWENEAIAAASALTSNSEITGDHPQSPSSTTSSAGGKVGRKSK